MSSNGRGITFKKIPLDKIIIDRRYQRPHDERWSASQAEAFDQHLFQPPEVSERSDGRFACFEGQHRIAMERKRGTHSVLCRVHLGLTEEEEAHYFAEFQLRRRGLRPYDRFRAQVRAGEPIQSDIQQIAEGWGFRMAAGGASPTTITAVTAMEQIYQRGGPTHLDELLAFIVELWEGEQGVTQGQMLLGASAFLLAFGPKVTDAKKKKLFRHSPVVILRRSVQHIETHAVSTEGVAKELRKVAGLTRAAPVRYTRTFGAPPKPTPKPRPKAKVKEIVEVTGG